jgi:hypothetical protein
VIGMSLELTFLEMENIYYFSGHPSDYLLVNLPEEENIQISVMRY